MHRSLLATLLAAPLLACSLHPAPPAETVPAAPAAAEASRRTLTLDPEELTYDDAAGTVTFHPDSRRQSAAYTRYVLDLASLEAALGGRPEAPVQVLVEVTGGEPRNETPADPMVAQPQGGFAITIWTGRVVAKGG
ncbi:MAG: hypothetical protein V4850_36480 [Myxococcota bacterium]